MNRASSDIAGEGVNAAGSADVAAANLSAIPDEPVARRRHGAFAVAARLLRIAVRGELWPILAGLALMLSGALVGLLQPWPLKFIVDALADATKPPPLLTHIAGALPQGAGPHGATLAYISVLCLGLLLISVVSAGINLLSTWVLVASGLRMVFKLRCRMFDHIQRLPVSFHDASTVGDSLYRVTWDTYSVQSLFNQRFVGAALHHASALEHNYLIHKANSRKVVRYDNGGSAGHKPPQRDQQISLGLCIQPGGGFIEHNDLGVF